MDLISRMSHCEVVADSVAELVRDVHLYLIMNSRFSRYLNCSLIISDKPSDQFL